MRSLCKQQIHSKKIFAVSIFHNFAKNMKLARKVALFDLKFENLQIRHDHAAWSMPYLEFLPYLSFFLKTFGWSYSE